MSAPTPSHRLAVVTAAGRERRAFPRHSTRASARCRPAQLPLNPASWARVVDVSRTGVGLLTAVAFAAGDQVEIELSPPAATNDLVRAAEVCWVAPEPGGWYRLGCRWDRGLTFAELEAFI